MVLGSAVKVIETKIHEVPGLGDRIKEARKGSGRTVTDVAAAAGMSVQNWYRIEREQQELPLETLRLIEKSLGVDFGLRIEGDD